MIEFTIETRIERPPAAVFEYITDPAKLDSWQTNTVSAKQQDDRPLGLGTRLEEVHRAPGGKRMTSIVEVSEFERDRVLGLRVVQGTPIHVRITLEDWGDGTLMRFSPHGSLSGPMRLAQPLLSRLLKRQFERDCANLKRVLEG